MTTAEIIEKLNRCIPICWDGCSQKCELFNAPNCHEALARAAADALEAAEQRIAELEAQMPKEGEWIATRVEVDGSRFSGERCSRCGWWKSMGIYNYCPNCGARMRGEHVERTEQNREEQTR